LYIYEGARTGVAVSDLDNDGYLDMIVGNYSGGLAYYKGSIPLPYNDIDVFNNTDLVNVLIFPNPANNSITLKVENELNDKSIEYIIYNSLGKIVLRNALNNSSMNIDVLKFPNGIYIVNIITYNKHRNKVITVNKKFSIVH